MLIKAAALTYTPIRTALSRITLRNFAMYPIYLDINATYGTLESVQSAIKSTPLEPFGNPSSIHLKGQRGRYIVEEARDAIRALLELPRDGIVIFTSGATESNNTCLLSPFWHSLSTNRTSNIHPPELVTTTIEHPSVIEAANRLQERGVKVHFISPRSDKNFYPDDFAEVINERTKLVSVMYVNNESGCILPVSKISAAVKKKNPSVLIHSDCVQALGKIKFKFKELGVDYISITAHKIGGLIGSGAIISNHGQWIDPLILGGPQETRRRAGTENILGIHSFQIAIEELQRKIDSKLEKLKILQNHIISEINSKLVNTKINFQNLDKVDNTISLLFNGLNTADLVVALDLANVYVSSGSACSSGKSEPSYVLQNYGLTKEEATSTIRISFCAEHTNEDLTEAITRIRTTTEKMEKFSKEHS